MARIAKLAEMMGACQYVRGDGESLAEAWGISTTEMGRLALAAKFAVSRELTPGRVMAIASETLIAAMDQGGAVGVKAAMGLLQAHGLLKERRETTHKVESLEDLKERVRKACFESEKKDG